MKTTKKYLSLFLILTTILSSITVFYISAAQATDETYIDTLETENVVIEHELVPVMASDCPSFSSFDWSNSHHQIHFQDDPIRYNHTYFSSGAAASLFSFTPGQAVSYSYYSGNWIFTYHMIGAGYVGGSNGSGEQCDYFLIIVKPSGEVITAYPIQ